MTFVRWCSGPAPSCGWINGTSCLRCGGVVGWAGVDERDLVGELAGWLGSRPVVWVCRSGLALVVARRAGELLRDLRAGGCGEEASVRVVLLAGWGRALCCGLLVDAAVAAAALAEWAVGVDRDRVGVVEDRAVDLTLRAGVVASDARRLAGLRESAAIALRGTRGECVALAGALGADADRSRCGLVWLELEDAAARGAGEALVAALLAQQQA